ncbi:unnamed protein product [Adineta steineri]|uniref:Uncharacterized protein n=1 Tax=Adineta steineri TaxID=433720 RepID=A0A815XC72_9BILA|nr:unnamed protein product [Adineta steineri]CAF1555677.1 unnamed protein product [Adineta steineri]
MAKIIITGDAIVRLEICETDQALMNISYPDIISLKMFRQQALDKHNEYRRKHCSQLLILSENLNETSQGYADRLATFDETTKL